MFYLVFHFTEFDVIILHIADIFFQSQVFENTGNKHTHRSITHLQKYIWTPVFSQHGSCVAEWHQNANQKIKKHSFSSTVKPIRLQYNIFHMVQTKFLLPCLSFVEEDIMQIIQIISFVSIYNLCAVTFVSSCNDIFVQIL